METLLIVEDDTDIRELIAFNLEMNGYKVLKAKDGEEGEALATKELPHLILLDLMLPGIDGYTLCSHLRKKEETRHIPIIMLTALGEDENIIKGLEMGADDYISKPFSPRVLIARVKAGLRRVSLPAESNRDVLKVGSLKIDSNRHFISLNDEPLDLSATEFAILFFLAKNPGWVFSRSQIIDAVKGEDYPVTARSVDVQILGIRRKLGDKGALIETVRGIGYRFKGEALE